ERGFERGERDNREMRARLAVYLAAEALAVAAVVARPIGHAVGIDIGLRRVGRRLWERVIAEAFRRLLEQGAGLGLDHRRGRVLPLPGAPQTISVPAFF